MPDILDENGLQTKDAEELRLEIEASYKLIYGADINIEPDSPDGQKIALLVQQGIDIRESITRVYNSLNPDTAVGVVLDQRVAINNIQRIAGDFTIQPVEITTDGLLVLQGLDANATDPDAVDGFTVQDNAGNQFILIDSFTFVGASTETLNFRAKDLGKVETTISTIQTMVTVVLGVTDVDNASGALTVGEDQESDPELRIRREQSVSNNSTSYVDSIRAGILRSEGVTDAKVFENVTDTIDADTIPPHSIWAIVAGGASEDIAEAIYATKSDGSDMKGAVEVEIISDSEQTFTVKFDRNVAEDLFIDFEIKKTDPAAVFDLDKVKEFLVDNLDYGINEAANSADIISLLTTFLQGGIPINLGVSKVASGYIDFLETSTKQDEFVVDVSRISIGIVA